MLYNRLAKLREERANGENGFTLIELLVVVVIIGILIAIAIPLYLNYEKGANDKATQSDVRNAVTALEQCNSSNGSYPSTLPAASGGSIAACTGNSINLSSNTTGVTYTAAPQNCDGTSTAPCSSYTFAASSGSSGNNKTYTYDSTTGQTATS